MTTDAAAERLRGGAALALASGVVLLELAAAVATLVAGTLLPEVERDLGAADVLPLLVSGGTLGLFTALPFAGRLVQRQDPRRVLAVGLVLTVAGAILAATAASPWVFASGRFVTGFAGALLAVLGVSAAITHLEQSLRLRVLALTSATWLLPAVAAPPLTTALESAVGWRWTLLSPLPLLLLARCLVVRATPPQRPAPEPRRPLLRPLLVPLGMAGFVALTASAWWALAVVPLAVALVGFRALVPAGTLRLRPGPPAALAALTLFGAGYVGASSLVTLLLTSVLGATLLQAGLALSAAPFCWAAAALLAPRLGVHGAPPAHGLGLCALGVAVLPVLVVAGGPWQAAVAASSVTGVGAGLAYPGLYLRATTAGGALTATVLATAAVVTEDFGGLVAASAGAALPSVAAALGLSRDDAFAWSYAGFAVLLALAACAASRTDRAAVSRRRTPRGADR